MKKILAIIVMTLLVASALCIAVFAADPAVIRVTGLKEDGAVYTPENSNYAKFDEGWEAAVDYALDEDWLSEHDIVRVVIDLFADWNAGNKGEFGKNNLTGFQHSTIFVPDNARITINMNGHAINRGLKTDKYNGEVICIGDAADVIINGGQSGDAPVMDGEATGTTKMGTITGGNSCNGAGGIRIQEGATVTLNNVILSKNRVEDAKGAAVAVDNGATFAMNGGAFLNNFVATTNGSLKTAEGTLFVSDSTAVLNKVAFRGNDCTATSQSEIYGVVVSMNGDAVATLNECKVENNALAQSNKISVFYCDDNSCTLNLNNTEMRKNGSYISYDEAYSVPRRTALFNSWGTVNINKGKIVENSIGTLFLFINTRNGAINVKDVEIGNNYHFLQVMDKTEYWQKDMGNNVLNLANCNIYGFTDVVDGDPSGYVKVNFIDCKFGNVRWGNGKRYCNFISTTYASASIMGEGSLPMIVALLSLVTSIASVAVCIALYKKKENPVVVSAEDEE